MTCHSCLKPDPLAARRVRPDGYVPTSAFRGDDVARSSDGLGWSALHLEHRVTPSGGESERALAFDTDVLIVHRRPTRMWQELDGAASDVAFRPGDAVLVPQGCSAKWAWDGPAETVVLALPPAPGRQRAFPSLPHLTDWALADATWRLWSEAKSGAGPLFADALGLRVSALIGRLALRDSTSSARSRRDRPLDDRRLSIATERMAAVEDGTGPSIAELGDLVGLSASHFARAFRLRTGVPPHRWAATLRLGRVLDALRRPGAAPSLSELAISTGFSDQAHMTREVRRATGLTPARLRLS